MKKDDMFAPPSQEELDMFAPPTEEELKKDEMDMFAPPTEEELKAIESEIPTSKTESAVRGAAQGLTFDFADEGLAGLQALYEDAKSMMSGEEPKVKPEFDELGRISNLEEMSQDLPYDRILEEERAKFKKAREDNPITYTGAEIGSGIIPALFTGGAAAAGKVGAEALKIGAKQGAKELVKEGTESGMKAALKEAAKIGAAQGAVTGLGTSEADLSTREGLGEALRDTAIGTTLGAGLGTVMPIAAKSAGKTLGKGKELGSYLLEKAPSVKTGLQFGEKYGLASNKKINNLMEDNTRDLVKLLQKNFDELGLEKKLSEEEAKALGKTYDVTGNIQEIVDTLKSKTKGLAPEDVDKANKLINSMEEGFLRIDKKRQSLIEQAEKEIAKKTEKSLNKATTAPLKAESKAVQEAEKRGIELEQLEDINKNFEDVAELPFDTKGGQISGQKAKFTDHYYDPATDSMVPFSTEKKYISDTTPFKPSEITVDELDDKLVAKYTDEATGEVFSKEGPKSRFSEIDFSQLTVDEMVDLIKVYGNKAFKDGGEYVEIYEEMWKMLRNKLPEISGDLPKNKQEMLKLFETSQIFGIDTNRLKNPSTPDIEKLVRTLPGKMDESKDIIFRNLVKEESELGSKIQDISELTDAKKYLGEGYTSATGEFTKAGVAQKIVSGAAVPVGAIYGKTIKAPSKFVANNVNEMSDEALQFASKKLSESNNEGLKAMGRQLDAALAEEGPVRSALVWSLSQNPAFRQKVRSILPTADKEVAEDLGIDLSNPVNDFIEPKEDNEPISLLRPEEQNREPAGEVVDRVSTQQSTPENFKQTLTEDIVKREGNAASLRDKYSDYVGLTGGKPNTRVKGSTSDFGAYYDSEGKLTVGIGDLITSEEEYQKKKDLTEEEALSQLQPNIDLNVKNTYRDLKSSGVDVENLPDNVKLAIERAAFQLGSLNKFPSLKRGLAEGDYEKAAIEAITSNGNGSSASSWLNQTPVRVRDFVESLTDDIEVKKIFNKYNTDDRFDFDLGETPENSNDVESEPLEDLVNDVKKVLDQQMKQQGSGDTTPEFHIDRTLAAIDALPTEQVNKDALEDEVIRAETFADVERIKNLLDGLRNLK